MKASSTLTKKKKRTKNKKTEDLLRRKTLAGLFYSKAMRNIIKIVVITICLFLGQSNVIAQNQIIPSEYNYINIEPLHAIYQDNDTIQLRLTSKIDSVEILFVIASLEIKLDSGWVPILEDIFAKKDDDNKFKNSKLVLRQEDTILNIPIAKLKDKMTDILSDASYRFCLEVRNAPLRKVELAYTNTFELQ